MWRSALVLGLIVAAVFLLAGWERIPDPLRTDTDAVRQPPSAEHLFGTDHLGRDVLSRVLYGGRRTLVMAVLATLIAAIPGTAIGLCSGYAQGWPDRLIGAWINAVLAIPGLLLALVVLTLLGSGLLPLTLATGIAQIAPFVLVVRAAVIDVRTATYIEAAKGLGAGHNWILRRHILPNIRPTLLAYIGVTFAYSVINGSALSFLGLGGDLGVPDWGVMLSEGRGVIRAAPWVGIAPGIAITITVIAVNALVDHMARPPRSR